MQMLAQINNKKIHWIVSATLLLATLCTVFFMAFSPSTTPKAHAGDIPSLKEIASQTVSGLGGAMKDVLFFIPNKVKNKVEEGAAELIDDTLGQLFEWIGKFLFWVSKLFFIAASSILDMAIVQSLNSDTLNSLSAVNDGWGLVRDVCNMFFIFILLYIAIATILQATTFNWKKTLGNLVIAALLINFSLFFTKVIIDVSNVFAMTFFNSMQTEVDGVTHYGPSTILKEGLNLETTFDSIDQQKVGADMIELDNMTRGIIWVFGSIFQMIASFVFFAGAFIFIKRTISFIFLMIFSPVGFVGFVLPATKKYSKMWWDAIAENAVIAPVFLFMLYLVCNIVRSGNLVQISDSDKSSLALAFTGEGSHYTIVLHFIILIGLMWGALVVAQAVSNKTASSAISFAGKMTGGMIGGTAMAGRRFGGGAGRAIRDSDWVKRQADKKRTATSRLGRATGSLGSMVLQGGDAAARSSFDIRKGKLGDPIGGTLNAVSSASGGKTGNIDTRLLQNRGEGGRQATVEAKGEAFKEKDDKLIKILATDASGNVRMVKDPITGEEITARELHARGLENRANRFESDAERPAIARSALTSTRKFLARDEIATLKKTAESIRKGDKETKDAIKAEGISVIETGLKKAMEDQKPDDIAKIMGDLTSDHIKEMNMEILFKPEVDKHLFISALKAIQKKSTTSERKQIRGTLESFANNYADKDKLDTTSKRTLTWLNSAEGGNGF